MSNRVAAFFAGGAVLIILAMIWASPVDRSQRACMEEVTEAVYEAAHGPIYFRPEVGIWLNEDGYDVGYSDGPDDLICVTR